MLHCSHLQSASEACTALSTVAFEETLTVLADGLTATRESERGSRSGEKTKFASL